MSTLARAVGAALMMVTAALAFVFAAVAAVAVGVLVLGAGLALRLWPKPRAGEPGDVLDARLTPAGWVVEGAHKG